jgi:hypothetical protein
MTNLPSAPSSREEWGPARPWPGFCEHCRKRVDERDAMGRIRAAHYWCENLYDPSDYE